jgi:GNAT superfamily N-acetyltransferase
MQIRRPDPVHLWAESGGRILADGYVHPAVNYAKRLGDWGFIATLGVRPAWRRRGLGLALLHESFRRCAEWGETTAALGVDSENPTGATWLYERAGCASSGVRTSGARSCVRVYERAPELVVPGAVALYERVGMHVVRHSDTWERTV